MTERSAVFQLLPTLLLVAVGGILGWLLVNLLGNSGPLQLRDLEGARVEWHAADVETVREIDALATGWSPCEAPCPPPEADRRHYWIRVTLPDPASGERKIVLTNRFPYLDHASLYARDASVPGGWRESRSGERADPEEKALWGRGTAFPVTLPARGGTTVYLKVGDYFRAHVVLEWWPDEQLFHETRARATLAEGICLGIILALLFYNAALWARLRFPDTGAYLLYLVFFAIFLLVARGNLPLIGMAIGSPVMEMVLTGSLALSGIFLMEFARRLLDLPERSPRASWLLRVAQRVLAVCVVTVLLAPWVPHVLEVVGLVVASSHIALLAAAVVAWRRGARAARYLVLIFGLLLSGIMPPLVVWVESLPMDRYGALGMTGFTAEMLLLSLAVAYRYSGIQAEKIAAQEQLLHEADQRRVMEEAYADELGLEVHERTRDLQDAMAGKDRMIAILAHDLGSPLTGLTRRARQLADSPTPDALEQFARESADMGGKLLEMIDDLVSWAKARGSAPDPARHPLSTVIEPMVALHQEAARRRGISLETSLPAGLVAVTDLVQAQTLVRNLLSNAIKFARTRVRLSARAVAGGVEITILDDGPGLPASVIRGFHEEAADFPPTGLGLRLCRDIGRSLGIRLQAVSPDGGGTEMSFVLPMEERKEAP